MELLWLLCSIASVFVRSTILSLLLAIRSLTLLPRFISPLPAEKPFCRAAVRLYEGRVSHSRTKPVFSSFNYPVRYALFDLDSAPHHSHLSADRAREAAGTNGPVFLLTIPMSVGYEQNPLKVYYCFDLDEVGEEEEHRSSPRLRNCIAEVTNTPWGEKVFFEFSPGSDVVAKPLHVSPFMPIFFKNTSNIHDMLGNWTIHADEPGENLFISVSVHHPTLGNYFAATLSVTRVHSSTTVLDLAIYFWLMPHKVAAWIYWQAIKLWWKNVSFIGHPNDSNPSYRVDALLRDKDMCPLHLHRRGMNHLYQNSSSESITRWCVWKDAEWPWCNSCT